MKLLLVILSFVILGCENSDRVKVRYVSDADTFILSNGEKIRLGQGVDAVESKQQYGQEAKAFTEREILGKEIKIVRKSRDKYGRTIAIAYTEHGNLALLLVRNGLAHATSYCKDKALINEYEKAKKEKRGVFASNWILPSQFRKINK